MNQHSIFSGSRFLKLLRQHILHSQTALLLGLLVGFGICFLVIAFMQFVGRPDQSYSDQFTMIAVFGYAILGSIYISSAFAPFRNKERAQDYLMIPGTALEKYLLELIFYPLLFVVLFPLIYLGAYALSTSFISLIKPGFVPFDLISALKELFISKETILKDGQRVSVYVPLLILWVSAIFSFAMAFFLGAVSFKKYTMLKTLLCLGIYIGLCFGLFFLLIDQLGWSDYKLSNGESYLSPFSEKYKSDRAILTFFSGWLICWGMIFGLVSFFKLKEKEV